ncbi:hypothetical protein ABZY14_12785 [Streptomyces sp. NPDC006617]
MTQQYLLDTHRAPGSTASPAARGRVRRALRRWWSRWPRTLG